MSSAISIQATIQHVSTGQYYKGKGNWTQNKEEAVWQSLEEAKRIKENLAKEDLGELRLVLEND